MPGSGRGTPMRRFLLVWAVVCPAVGLAIVATSGLGMPDFHDPANQTGSLARRAGADTAVVLLWAVVPPVLGFLARAGNRSRSAAAQVALDQVGDRRPRVISGSYGTRPSGLDALAWFAVVGKGREV